MVLVGPHNDLRQRGNDQHKQGVPLTLSGVDPDEIVECNRCKSHPQESQVVPKAAKRRLWKHFFQQDNDQPECNTQHQPGKSSRSGDFSFPPGIDAQKDYNANGNQPDDESKKGVGRHLEISIAVHRA